VVAELELLHAHARGRVRYRACAIHRNPDLSARIEALLSDTSGVRSARANPRTATLLVLLEPGTARHAVESALTRVLPNAEQPVDARIRVRA
jgi:hypothetical protein